MSQTNNPVIPVILSGGVGSRLWPLSRKLLPKQLQNLTGGPYTMLQETANRVNHLASPIVVCNEAHRFMVAEQLRMIADEAASIILEPVGRSTAPAITLAAIHAQRQDPEAIIAVFPADHVIGNTKAFKDALDMAIETARNDELVTFGIKPDKAETGYGYIKAEPSTDKVMSVECFVEKPDVETAKHFVSQSNYFWNSGMFVFKANSYLAALEQFEPEILVHCQQAIEQACSDLDFIRIGGDEFAKCADISIDYAVMERAKNVKVVPMDAGWSDVGSWDSLFELSDKDKQNNATIGDVLAIDSRNNLVHSKKLVATLGVDNLMVINTKDALLVAHRDKAQQVKDVVNQLDALQREEHVNHRHVHRPWGFYDLLHCSRGYQVKHINVKPGASLSLQFHHHRAEHWIVVRGTAFVEVGEEHKMVTENESVYIPIGEKHRLTNPGKMPLELIEVQTGNYLGEDDIVRLEDPYKR